MSLDVRSRLRLYLVHGGMIVPNPSAGGRCIIVPCYWCRTWLRRQDATLDHVIPRAEGGPRHRADNLVPACRDCNGDRGREWERSAIGQEWLRFLREHRTLGRSRQDVKRLWIMELRARRAKPPATVAEAVLA